MTYSVVPDRKIKDPRQLLFHFPSMNAQRYAQLVAEFHQDQMLRMAEQIAQGLGFLLIPSSCLHWKVKARIAAERKVNIGRCTYYMLKQEEIPKKSLEKFIEYIEEIKVC
jgi:hypothetical protein